MYSNKLKVNGSMIKIKKQTSLIEMTVKAYEQCKINSLYVSFNFHGYLPS